MKIIGLTGGIASGKSTVSRRLRALGAAVLDADAVAHELAEPGGPLWRAYVSRYGEKDALLPSGELDRPRIARRVFADPSERKWVDEMSHPVIRNEMLRRIDERRREGCPVVVLDVPLLYESGWDEITDEVWVVYVDGETQLSRLMRRDSLDEDAARRRIASQMPLSEKRRRADAVIDNGGPMADTMARIDAEWARVSSPPR